MRGEVNAQVMTGATYVGPAMTVAAYTLVELLGYPGLRAGGTSNVRGELWWVNQRLRDALDEFEGHPTLFCRTPITLAGGSAAEAYLVPAGASPGAAVIASGDWRRWRGRK